ncbi:hypothetical protein GOP47_0004644 [Adiantum capillus-veneris]|uniref:Pentatricopeptide repeat-containing protein n=1 Tax=Adiantum capillus-veneris TaxID=13818 RepID=A0A9D4ZPV8_ADICA|nr:hypothetical protein GOP47_0004644 [Adiantum capillus-veneris]
MKRSGREFVSLHENLTALEGGLLPPPSVESFARRLIKRRGERAYALRTCAYVYKSGLEAHASIANCLVSMLVVVGSLHDAQQVFDSLPYHNGESLNSLIIGYVKCGRHHQALNIYRSLPKDDLTLPLSSHAFVSLLKACTKLKDWERGSEVHAHIACTGRLKSDLHVGSALLDMYAKCGAIDKAQQVFDELPDRNVVTWTALLAGYAESGQSDGALKCFKLMQSEGLSPNAVTYVCVLKACGSKRDTTKGQDVHEEIERQGLLESNLFVGSALVNMYSKCGLLTKAQEVFDKLPARDVVSWTALISGYTENGYGEEALECFEQMQLRGFAPNAHTFACSLKACGSIGAVNKAMVIQAEVEKQGLLKKDFLLGSILVDIYSKNGLLEKAKQVFDNLPIRNKVTWTTLIMGYTEHERGKEALECFDQMQLEGIFPDAVTLIYSLKACGLTQAREKVQEIHLLIKRQGLLKKDLSVCNALIETYVKCGCLAMAQQVFKELPGRNVFSWNPLIMGFFEHGYHEEALQCFRLMKLDGIVPDTLTYVCTLKACSNMEDIDMCERIIAEAEERGVLERDLFVGSTLVDLYAKCGSLLKAQEVFDKVQVRDVVLWNALIAGYAEEGQGEEALSCFDQMQLEGVSPNAVTLLSSVKACCRIGAAKKGQELHMEIERRDLLQSEHVGNTLIDMYAKNGLIAKAQQVFNKIQHKDVISWTTLMAGYIHCADGEGVFQIFDTMLGEGIKPNTVTFVVVLNACSRKGMYNKSETYFEAMNKQHGVVPDLEHHNCLIDLLGRVGQVDKAVDLIREKKIIPNIVMLRSVLSACKYWGNAAVQKSGL